MYELCFGGAIAVAMPNGPEVYQSKGLLHGPHVRNQYFSVSTLLVSNHLRSIQNLFLVCAVQESIYGAENVQEILRLRLSGRRKEGKGGAGDSVYHIIQ